MVTTDPASVPRRRDAARTRQLLLTAARHRFTEDGYAATTVRDIAEDAGVNVALISRYFQSKEGLFEECLAAAVDELKRAASTVTGSHQVADAIARQAVGADPQGHLLRLLLRSSGDDRAEQMRIGILRTFGERLATAAGWHPDDPDTAALLLRAQLVLATAVGIAVLRRSPGLTPLDTATEADLAVPLRHLVDALLNPEPCRNTK